MMDEEYKLPTAEESKRKIGMNGYVEFYEKVKSCQKDSKHCKAAILTHRCPDPDAIGSMVGLSWILEKQFDMKSEMFYAGEISHPQNAVLDNLINPGLKRIEEFDEEEFDLLILVDTIPENAGLNGKKVKFDIVIDHHRDTPSDFEGVLIHKKVGACASIIFDMMKHFAGKEDWAHEWLDEGSDSDQKLATAMIAGIATDTEYMMSDDSTSLEFEAFSTLFPFRNPNYLKQIVFFKKPKLWIEKNASTCSDAKITDDGYAVVCLGYVPEKHRDLIAYIADEMLQWPSVSTTIAFGVVGGDRIEGSVRSLNASLIVSDFCKQLGGCHGSGGGKQGKGAYRLPLAGFSIDPDEEEDDIEEAIAAIKNKETKRILREIKK